MPFLAPVVGAVAGAIGAVGSFLATSAIGSTLLGIGASIGLNYLANALAPKPENDVVDTTPRGVQTSITLGGAVPRSAIFGVQATAGQLIYWNIYGQDNRVLQMVYALGDGEHDAIQRMWVNGKLVTFGAPDGTGIPINEYYKDGQPYMWINFHNGAEDQLVNGNLVTFANPAGRWTENDRLAGICYVVVIMTYDETLFTSGIPQFLFEVRGLKLYDIRKDSTAGGSGPHRWNDPSTWEWSDNPAVGLYNYQRGIWLNGELILGQGVAALDLIGEYYIAAANACDESVPLKNGGVEKRYRIGMQVSSERQHRDVITDFSTAMAGYVIESAGAFGAVPGVAFATAMSFTDKDLVAGQPVKYAAKRSRADLINAIFGTYSEPNQNWQEIALPARTSAADELTDGERLAVEIAYPMIFSDTQGQRVAEIHRRLARHQSTATVTLPFKFCVLEPGDWVEWTSERFGFEKTFQIINASINSDQTITLSLREISTSVYTWNPAGDELNPQQPGDLPGINPLITTVSGFTLQDVQINGAGQLTIPGLKVLWSPVQDRTVDAVIIQYRVKGTDNVKEVRCDRPSAGEYILTDGIQAATVYEARASITTTPPRVAAWTPWVEETAPPNHVVPFAAELGDSAVSLESFTEELRDLVAEQLPDQLGDIDWRTGRIAAAAAEQDAANYLDKTATRKILEARMGDVDVLIQETAQIAQDINGRLGAMWMLTINNNGYVSGMVSYNDGTTSNLTFVTDQFRIAAPGVTGGDPVIPFTMGIVNGNAKLVMRGDMIADGAITAQKLTVGSLSAISASFGTATFSGQITAQNGKMVINLNSGFIAWYD